MSPGGEQKQGGENKVRDEDFAHFTFVWVFQSLSDSLKIFSVESFLMNRIV
jgi:hypothetical protein